MDERERKHSEHLQATIRFAFEAPGAITALCESPDAMRIVAHMVANPLWPQVRAKLLRSGQLEHDIVYLENYARSRCNGTCQ